ncbi:MAG: esterase family protein, partial [Candidatus Acidiferrales bacterium]
MNRRFRLVLFSLVVLLAWFVAPASSHAAGRAECRSLPSKILARDVAFCVLLPPSYDADKTRRYPVLYFLHG